MPNPRPTIRCLVDELSSEIEDQNQRSALVAGRLADIGPLPLDEIVHPLLRKAQMLDGRPAADLHGDAIASVSDNVFYKVKTGRHRGAVWIDGSGTLWLCAAGIRREGDPDDFYADFERKCIGGSDLFLPTESDRNRQLLETVDAADCERQRLLAERVMTCIANAATSQALETVDLPTMVDPETLLPRSTARLHVELSLNGPEYPSDIYLSVTVVDYAGARYNDVIIEVQGSIPGVPINDWDVVPASSGHQDPCWTVIVREGWLEAFLDEVNRRGARDMSVNPPDLTDGCDDLAHLVPKSGLTEAVFRADTVRAICGRTFRPIHDHDGMEVCPNCLTAEKRLEEAISPSL